MTEEPSLEDWQEAARIPIINSTDSVVKLLELAAKAGLWVEIAYSGGSSPGEVRWIRPLNVFGKQGFDPVYVSAYCQTRQEERSFRCDRMTIITGPVSDPKSGSESPKVSDEDRILQLLSIKPGLKANDISRELGLDRREVNATLHGELRGRVTQDKSYRWSVQSQRLAETDDDEQVGQLNTPLARLCRYYLDCLGQDDDIGVSAFASSRYDIDYVPVESLPFLDEYEGSIFESDAAKKQLNKVRRDHRRLVLYLGYPTRLSLVRSKKGWEGFMVEPVLLFPFHFDSGDWYAAPTLSSDPPLLNFKVLRALATTDSGNSLDEAIQLAEELGFNNPHTDLPELEEIAPRLKSARPEWDWREEPDPFSLSDGLPLADIKEQGIYNRAILISGERSPYTQGLETELGGLARLEETDYCDTALGAWLRGGPIESPVTENEPLLEILPLNSEQRQSVLQGLCNPLTVITGPPGTGKSQVVTSLLINAAWQGKKVLFASKNNKAVDVVETRVNALGPRPVLLRLGAREYRHRLAEYLVSLLAATATAADQSNYQRQLGIHEGLRQRFDEIEGQATKVIELRNEVDRLEQAVEAVRTEVGNDEFRAFRSLETDRHFSALRSLSASLDKATRTKQPLLVRVFWGLVKGNRYRRLADEWAELRPTLSILKGPAPEAVPDDASIQLWHVFRDSLDDRLNEAALARTYFDKLDDLETTKPFEELSRDHLRLVQKVADSSEQLWEYWLRLQPNRMSSEERNLLSEYGSILRMIAGAGASQTSRARGVMRKYHSLFPRITDILSCWAVTSLSTRGGVPFEPGFFDIVVVDEASQCDIASALPLLYRAKRAVIIGDPKQLPHISSLPIRQDTALLTKHDLVEGYLKWGYSKNSLFHLSSGFTKAEDIVQLRDHHRSHADIIKFPNDYFYGGKLRVATKYERLKVPSRDEPAIRWMDVKGKVVRPQSGGAVNDVEARAVAKEVERVVLNQGYRGTVGVVTPFRSQANRIRDLVHQNDALSQNLATMDFLADTVHRFQGDERDLMIFSPVVSSGIADTALGFLNGQPNLFNVAITRARAALVVIGDRQAALSCGVNYLSEFATYVANLGSQAISQMEARAEFGAEYPPVARPETVSDWERLFYRSMYAAGLRPIPQFDVEQYTLDFALLSGDRKLDIEVDGERYHRDWDGELCRRDQIRSQRLIEIGWDVMRFWVYQIRDDMDGCISRVTRWLLDELDSPPVATGVGPPDQQPGGESLNIDDKQEPESSNDAPVSSAMEKEFPRKQPKSRGVAPSTQDERPRVYDGKHDQYGKLVDSIRHTSPIPADAIDDHTVIPLLVDIQRLMEEGAAPEEIKRKVAEARKIDSGAVSVLLSRMQIRREGQR